MGNGISATTDRWLGHFGNVGAWAVLALIGYFSLEAVSFAAALGVATLFAAAGAFALFGRGPVADILRAPGNLLVYFVRFGS
jgi:hypothetical protein